MRHRVGTDTRHRFGENRAAGIDIGSGTVFSVFAATGRTTGRSASALPHLPPPRRCPSVFTTVFSARERGLFSASHSLPCLLGFNLPKATAHAKILNFTSNFAALIFFILGGEVRWQPGLVMMAGGFVGARLGAGMVLTKGQKLIRPMPVAISFVMTAKIMYDYGWFARLF